MSARIGRNDPCPCGSGKKFKKCHAGEVAQQHEPPPGARRLNVSLDERNDLFLDAIEDIFGLRNAGSWDNVKRRVTRDRVLALYQAHNGLWAAEDPQEVLPARLDGLLTSLFIGKIEPEELAQRIFRFGLYTDQILVPNPFTFPTPPGRHPLEVPEQYLRDTLKMVYFMARIAPWIRSGFVQLIGDPAAYDATFRWESMRKAEGRMNKRGLDPRDLEGLEDQTKAFVQRMLGYLPPSQLEKSVTHYMPDMAPETRERIVAALKRKNALDPLALPPLEEGQAPPHEFVIERYGGMLESALYICDRTGAFPYTESHTRWRDLLAAGDELPERARTWTPLTKAFQELDFHFLDNVDSQFAARIREEERLNSFRIFLRDLWAKIGGSADAARSETLARDFAERLS